MQVTVIQNQPRLSEPVPGGPTTQFLIELATAKEAFICGGLIERDGDRHPEYYGLVTVKQQRVFPKRE